MPAREPDSPLEESNRAPVSFGDHPDASGAMGVAAAMTPGDLLAQAAPQRRCPTPARRIDAVTLKINGQPANCKSTLRTTLLDCLRETVNLTHKKGAINGQCGLHVHVNGRRVVSCLSSRRCTSR